MVAGADLRLAEADGSYSAAHQPAHSPSRLPTRPGMVPRWRPAYQAGTPVMMSTASACVMVMTGGI